MYVSKNEPKWSLSNLIKIFYSTKGFVLINPLFFCYAQFFMPVQQFQVLSQFNDVVTYKN